MDTRALILGGLAAVATVCSTVLFALGERDGGALLGGLAATTAAYVVGLYSEPQSRGDLDG